MFERRCQNPKRKSYKPKSQRHKIAATKENLNMNKIEKIKMPTKTENKLKRIS